MAYTALDSTVTPQEIRWADGRRWRVEVEMTEPVGPKPVARCAQRAWRYRVRILPSGQRKWLYLDWPGWHAEVRQ